MNAQLSKEHNYTSSNLNSVMLFVLTAVMGYVAYTTNQSAIDIARQGERIASIEARITVGLSGTFSRQEASAQHTLLDQRTERVETWTQNLSERLRTLEEFVRDHHSQ